MLKFAAGFSGKLGVSLLAAALLLQSAGCGLHPAANAAAGPASDSIVSHQPSTLSQMERLVTPDDPAVKQALYDALNQADTIYKAKPSEFERIREWAVSNCVYKTDQETHGVSDYWQTPAETIKLRAGDCEDFAILLCSLYRAYGVPAGQVYAAVGYTSANEAHAWLVEKCYSGIWRILDTQSGAAQGLEFDSGAASKYTTTECFNDSNGFYGKPVLPAGVYEYLSSGTGDPQAPGDSGSYYRYVNAGQEIKTRVEWLPYSVYWPFNPGILNPWTFNVYDLDSRVVFSWSGKDTAKTLDFTPSQTGVFRIEIIKRDDFDRPVRITISPKEGWTQDEPLRIDLLRVDLSPFPSSRIKAGENPSEVIIPPPQETLPPPPAPVTVPHEQLVQHALDVINTPLIQGGYEPLGPGTNTAAQQHADDMLAHDFASGWGTDGTTPHVRYTMGEGLGNPFEYDYRTEIMWDGEPSSFAGALLSAIEQSENNFQSPGYSMFMVTSSSGPAAVTNTVLPSDLEMEPGKLNIGIAYNSKYLYLVIVYESNNTSFSQVPTIQDGLLTFAGENAPGVTLTAVNVSFNDLPTALTAAQISYSAAGYYGERGIAYAYDLSIMYPSTKPLAMLNTSPGIPYLDPHSVPLDLPPSDKPGYPIEVLIEGIDTALYRWSNGIYDFSGFKTTGIKYSFELDLSHMITACGKGVYTISIMGASLSGNVLYSIPLSTYAIFVGN